MQNTEVKNYAASYYFYPIVGKGNSKLSTFSFIDARANKDVVSLATSLIIADELI